MNPQEFTDIIDPFTNVEYIPPPVSNTSVPQELTDITNIQMGYGSKVFRADEQGIWLGAKRFVDAPFSVDMEGNIIATTLSLGNYISKTDTGQNVTGDFQLGASNMVLDGNNKRILINDGTNNRVLIGFQSGGF